MFLTASLWAWGWPGFLAGCAPAVVTHTAADDIFSTPGALYGPVRKAGPLAPRQVGAVHLAGLGLR